MLSKAVSEFISAVLRVQAAVVYPCKYPDLFLRMVTLNRGPGCRPA